MTTYVILRESRPDDVATGDGAVWVEVDRLEARSDASAIRTYKPADGVYVAVPARSWRPRTVKAEQTTRLTIT